MPARGFGSRMFPCIGCGGRPFNVDFVGALNLSKRFAGCLLGDVRQQFQQGGDIAALDIYGLGQELIDINLQRPRALVCHESVQLTQRHTHAHANRHTSALCFLLAAACCSMRSARCLSSLCCLEHTHSTVGLAIKLLRAYSFLLTRRSSIWNENSSWLFSASRGALMPCFVIPAHAPSLFVDAIEPETCPAMLLRCPIALLSLSSLEE
jgi:hypothetical protein